MDPASSPNSNSTATARAPTRREMLAYAQIGALLLLLVLFAVALIQAVVLQPNWIDLGTTDALRSDTPTTRGDYGSEENHPHHAKLTERMRRATLSMIDRDFPNGDEKWASLMN